VPLANAEEVFRTASAILGDRLRRIPDGETGERGNWVGWQFPVLARHPAFETVPHPTDAGLPSRQVKLREDAARELTFGELGYAAAAQASYATFSSLKQAGVVPARCRFQVSLPTPLAPVTLFVTPEDQGAVEPPYEARLLAELAEITAAIPHDELAIQWDVAVEIALWEGVWPAYFTDIRPGIIERLVRLGNLVPVDVELGYHLCYGDAGHRHFKQPADTANLVHVANTLTTTVGRPINWIHMPVPRDRTDNAYFAPLRNLTPPSEMEIYLGLVHFTDSAAGARERIRAAQQAIRGFGVATECGLGRRPPETVPDLLRLHAEVSDPLG
jgi:hypothetical protein